MQEFGAIGDPEGDVCPPEAGWPAFNRSEQRVYDVAVKIASWGEKNILFQFWSIWFNLIHFDPFWSIRSILIEMSKEFMMSLSKLYLEVRKPFYSRVIHFDPIGSIFIQSDPVPVWFNLLHFFKILLCGKFIVTCNARKIFHLTPFLCLFDASMYLKNMQKIEIPQFWGQSKIAAGWARLTVLSRWELKKSLWDQ